MNSAEVLVKFKGDTKDLDDKTKKADSSLKGFASGVGKAFKVASVAVTTATVAVAGLVKKSVDAYAEFEQLEGGLVSLFGEGSAEMNAILKKSEQAYKDLTMSQNDYLTNFQSSYPLVNAGLSENADGIEYTNKMLQLSSDLFNTYGGSIEGYQNAINWALKGSFVYLDNLNLGIKGTQEGFIEAANSSGILGREIQNVSELTSDEIIDVIQHYAEEYGVWGKTGQEASTTIIGSLNMVKATWQNLISGFSQKDADIGKLFDNLIKSATTFMDNIMPVIERALGSIADNLPTIIEKLVAVLPGMIQKLLPGLINGAISLLKSLSDSLPSLIPILMDGIILAIKSLVKILPQLIQSILSGAILIIQALAEELPTLLPLIIDAILSIIPILIDNLPLFIKAGMQLIIGLTQGIIQSIPKLLTQAWNIIKSLIGYFNQLPGMLVDIGKNLIKGLWNGISNVTSWIINKIKGFGNSVLKAIKSIFGVHSPSTEFEWIGK
ncbi:MAG: hypothetical protein VZR33_08420, partial [Methanosphaera sp.]|nr:hypothetical protein [Methanosphaera sp.]